MSNDSLTEVQTNVKTQFVAVPAFDLAVYTDQHYVEVNEVDFTQSTTFPAERGIAQHPGPCNANLPHKSMSLTERVDLMRGPDEDGID